MSLTAGTRLGPYEVVAPLGAGGMGEVYRARDARLGRDVAIKILPAVVAGDPERKARFEGEARTLASLNHPNIAGIHGVEDGHGMPALVLELVEGPTLADRIAQGPTPIDDALVAARQIADALEAAPDVGIIHRDLKPANIKLRPDGAVKVLDFGLAKAIAAARDSSADTSGRLRADGLSHSPTITGPIGMTGVGVLLGTAAYMPPEPGGGGFGGATWGTGGTIVFATAANRALMTVSEGGGSAKPLTTPAENEAHNQPHFLPDGRSRVDRDGKEDALAGLPPGNYGTIRVSPDGTRLAYDVGRPSDVWVYEFARGTTTRITTTDSVDGSPLWTVDGSRVVYSSSRDGRSELYVRNADGTGTAERVMAGDSPAPRLDADGWTPAASS